MEIGRRSISREGGAQTKILKQKPKYSKGFQCSCCMRAKGSPTGDEIGKVTNREPHPVCVTSRSW